MGQYQLAIVENVFDGCTTGQQFFLLPSGRVRGRLKVCKVAAHEDVSDATDLVHEWAILQNAAADTAAKCANQSRPASFWHDWNALRTSYNADVKADAVVGLRVAIGLKATRERQCCPRSLQQREQRPPDSAACLSGVRDLATPALMQRFGADYVIKLKWWMQEAFRLPSQDIRPTWMSAVDLLFSFLLSAKFLPQVYKADCKQWQRGPHFIATVSQRSRWFLQQLKAVARGAGHLFGF